MFTLHISKELMISFLNKHQQYATIRKSSSISKVILVMEISLEVSDVLLGLLLLAFPSIGQGRLTMDLWLSSLKGKISSKSITSLSKTRLQNIKPIRDN